MAWRFHIEQAGKTTRQVAIVAGAKLGRQADCAVHLDDGMVSRQHAEVIERQGALVLKDLGSANGLIVDGRLLREVLLAPGMRIELPPFTLMVQEVGQESGTANIHGQALKKAMGAAHNSNIQAPKSLAELLDVPSPMEPAEKVEIVDAATPTTSRSEATEIEAATPAASDDLGDIQALMQPYYQADSSTDEPATKAIRDATQGQDQTLGRLATTGSSVAQTPLGNRTMIVPFAATPRLMPLNFKMEQSVLPLSQPLITIGRNPAVDLLINHPSVSQQHAQLHRKGERLQIVDLQSSNGTRVNGDLVNQCLLKCHDIVEFGDIKFEFLEGPAMPQARSHNVIELIDDPEFDGVTRKPPARPAMFVSGLGLRPLTLGLSALALLLLATPLIHQQRQGQRANGVVPASHPVEAVEPSEKERIIAHQLTQSRRLIDAGKYSEAKVKVDLILEKLAADNLEAITMREEITRVTAAKQEQARLQEERLFAAKDQLRQWMTQGGAAFDRGQLDEARQYFRQVLAIQPDHQAANQQLARIEAHVNEVAERNRRGREMQATIQETYTKGVVAYNAGNLLEAAKYLREVITYPQHPNYDEARIALNDVEEKLTVEVEEKITEARNLYVKGYLSEARDLILEARFGNSKHLEAKELEQKILAEVRERAKQLYREGYTFENLVQDYLSAKERYKKVLELLPDKGEEYHQKASARLKSLES